MTKRETLVLIKKLMENRETISEKIKQPETLNKQELNTLTVRHAELEDEINTLIPIYRKMCQQDKT